MKELLEFLTSKEIMVVYVIAGLACLLCFIIYIVEKNNEKVKRKQNTKELNRLVEEVAEELPSVEETPVMVNEPVLEKIIGNNEVCSVSELLESTAEMEKVNFEAEAAVATKQEVNLVIEPMDIVTEVVEETVEEPILVQEVKKEKKEEELQYTSIEPDQATAKLELEKLTEELRRQEAEKEAEVQNIALTNYEEEQEENAIISLDELVKKSKEMYEANELTQYADEGNEPISLQDLERKMGEQKADNYDEPFIIENIISEDDLNDETLEINQDITTSVPTEVVNTVNVSQPVKEVETVSTNSAPSKVSSTATSNINKKFKSSPIISPIYGIEKTSTSNTELELENTANYEKLDEEIKKTNEFLMTLKELQKKLD